MNKKNIFLKSIILISLLISSFAMAKSKVDSIDDYKIMTENFPPYNFGKKGDLHGISADIFTLMLKDMKSKHKMKNIDVYSWAKAYHELQTNPHSILFSTMLTDEREHQYKWVGPIAPVKITLFALKEKNIKIVSLKDLDKYKVGVVRGDAGEEILLINKVEKKNITSVLDIEHNIKKLESGRIDLIAYDELSLQWHLKNNEFRKQDNFESVFTIKDSNLYFALNKNTPDEIVKKLQDSFDRVKASKKYQEVIKKYNN